MRIAFVQTRPITFGRQVTPTRTRFGTNDVSASPEASQESQVQTLTRGIAAALKRQFPDKAALFPDVTEIARKVLAGYAEHPLEPRKVIRHEFGHAFVAYFLEKQAGFNLQDDEAEQGIVHILDIKDENSVCHHTQLNVTDTSLLAGIIQGTSVTQYTRAAHDHLDKIGQYFNSEVFRKLLILSDSPDLLAYFRENAPEELTEALATFKDICEAQEKDIRRRVMVNLAAGMFASFQGHPNYEQELEGDMAAAQTFLKGLWHAQTIKALLLDGPPPKDWPEFYQEEVDSARSKLESLLKRLDSETLKSTMDSMLSQYEQGKHSWTNRELHKHFEKLYQTMKSTPSLDQSA